MSKVSMGVTVDSTKHRASEGVDEIAKRRSQNQYHLRLGMTSASVV